MRGSWVMASLLGIFGASCIDTQRYPPAPLDEGGGATGVAAAGASSVGGAGTSSLGAPCDPSRQVEKSALLVTDPDVLERFSLERVLQQLARTGLPEQEPEPLALLQGLFDVDSERAEAQLAHSSTLLTSGEPDSFIPVALVNRFDLTANDFSNCGTYVIVYAKRSGLDDPSDRVFLAFQAVLPNVELSLANCRPAAELWAGLSELESEERGAALEQFFFEGVGGLEPAIHAQHFAVSAPNSHCEDRARCGQVQVSDGMQAPWQFRQLRLSDAPTADGIARLSFEPVSATTSIKPDLLQQDTQLGLAFTGNLRANLGGLLSSVPRMYLRSSPAYELETSAVTGPNAPDYLSRVEQGGDSSGLLPSLEESLAMSGDLNCPGDDPLDARAILRRAAALSCAGCHAPSPAIAEDRSIGCGQAWPESLGTTHIDEQGQLSTALREVFLPERAHVLATYLQGCDPKAILANVNFQHP